MFDVDKIMAKFNIDKSHGFQTWFMGTNEFDIWQNIIISIKTQQNNFDVWNTIINSNTLKFNQVAKNRFEFKIGNFNILSNPISKRGSLNFLAGSTLRQYIDFGIALRFVNEEASSTKIFEYKLYPNFLNFISSTNEENLNDIFLDKICNLLQTYIYSNNDKVRSIGCSISWSILYFENINGKNEISNLISDKIIALKKKDNKGNGMVQFEGTYKSLANQLIKKFGIEYLTNIIERNCAILANNNSIGLVHRIDDLARLTSNYRSQLRPNIIQNRVQSHDWYSDFKDPIVERHISDLEACHIKEVNQIHDELKKHNLSDLDKRRLFEQLSDSNNGILLNRDAHYLFDDRLFEIDPRNGQVIIENNQISKKRVCQAFGIDVDQSEKIFLKDNVLNQQMKEYLQKRI